MQCSKLQLLRSGSNIVDLVTRSPVVKVVRGLECIRGLESTSCTCSSTWRSDTDPVFRRGCMVAAIGCSHHKPFLWRAGHYPTQARLYLHIASRPVSRALGVAAWSLPPCRCPSKCISRQYNICHSAAAAFASAAPAMTAGVSQRMKELKNQGRCTCMPAHPCPTSCMHES